MISTPRPESARRVRAQRLAAQCLSRPCDHVADAVRRLVAVQAQDLNQARWALAIRAGGVPRAAVDAAFAQKQVVRSWCLRGTLHLVAPDDLPFLIKLLGPRNLARAAARLRQLRIRERDVASARDVVENALDGKTLSREELFTRLEAAGQAVGGQRGVHLLYCLSQSGVLCQTGEKFALVADCLPRRRGARRILEGDEALGALAKRYLEGHGPATAEDFAFWTGLGKREAKRALDLAGEVEPVTAPVPKAMLLPGYDEYLLGYADRSACLDPRYFTRVVPGGNGVFLPIVVVDGRIGATWRKVKAGNRTTIWVQPFDASVPLRPRAIKLAADAYASYSGESLEVVVAE